MMIKGHFVYKYGIRVWVNEEPVCNQWGHLGGGPHEDVRQVGCYAEPLITTGHINLFGQWRYPPGLYFGPPSVTEECVEMNPTLSPKPPKQKSGLKVLTEDWHLSRGAKPWSSPCSWHHLHQVF